MKYRVVISGKLQSGVPAIHEYECDAEADVLVEGRVHLEACKFGFEMVESCTIERWDEVCIHCHQEGWITLLDDA